MQRGSKQSAGQQGIAVRASRIRARLLFVVLDTCCVVAGYGLAEVAYFRNRAPAHYVVDFTAFLLAALVTTLVANHVFGLYQRMWRHAGAQEARQLVLSAATTGVVLVGATLVGRLAGHDVIPLSVIVVGSLFCTTGMGLIRFHSRLFAWQRGTRQMGLRVGVVGSEDMGAAAVREMQRSPSAGLIPVAVFDSNVKDHGFSLLGVPVVGDVEDIPDAAARYTLQQILLAVPNPEPELVERVLKACEEAGVSMKVLPGVHNLMSMSTHLGTVRQAREPSIQDLLGRTPLATELDAVRSCLEGRRVLVTGAGGSIGSEMCRQIASLNPSLLIMVDHDETHLHDAAASISVACDQSLTDVSDRAAVREVLRRYRPHAVYHAAAHKHVPVLEQHPVEAARTNAFGTLNVVEASVEVGVERFVLISSDKAVRPSSVMGASKRLGEQIVLAHAPDGASYCSVRFGNVLGSRGSVIPTFNRQIENGGPVTVTDPRMTRFFMSVEEAVQLVLQASVLSAGGEIFMLDMGRPVRIVDLAERMIRLSGYQVGADVPISFIGRRPGEKLGEELCTPEEAMVATGHPSIHRLVPIATPPDELRDNLGRLHEATVRRDGDLVRSLIFATGAPETHPPGAPTEPAVEAVPAVESVESVEAVEAGDVGDNGAPVASPHAMAQIERALRGSIE